MLMSTPPGKAHSETGLPGQGWGNLQAGFVPTLTQQAAPTGPAGSWRDGEKRGGVSGARQDDWAVSEGPDLCPNSPSPLARSPVGNPPPS